MWVRILMAVIIGILPALYIYIDRGEALDLERIEADERLVRARKDFLGARDKKGNLPELEEKHAFTQQELRAARERLPDNYDIDRFLEKIATIANEVNVRLDEFDPQKEEPAGTNHVQMPIKMKLLGKYSQVVSFMDRVVHFYLDRNCLV